MKVLGFKKVVNITDVSRMNAYIEGRDVRAAIVTLNHYGSDDVLGVGFVDEAYLQGYYFKNPDSELLRACLVFQSPLLRTIGYDLHKIADFLAKRSVQLHSNIYDVLLAERHLCRSIENQKLDKATEHVPSCKRNYARRKARGEFYRRVEIEHRRGVKPATDDDLEGQCRTLYELYLIQSDLLTRHGESPYLERVAFPLVPLLEHNRRRGVAINADLLQRLKTGIERNLNNVKAALAFELPDPDDSDALEMAFSKRGLMNWVGEYESLRERRTISKLKFVLVRNGEFTSNQRDFCNSIDDYYKYRDALKALNELESRLIDSRIHPKFVQYQTITMRTANENPAPLMGALRPLVIPSTPERGIFEVDVSGQEPYLAGRLSGDNTVMSFYSDSDFYLRMGVELFPEEFEKEHREQIRSGENLDVLKSSYKKIRDRLCKNLGFGIFYGKSIESIAQDSAWTISQTERIVKGAQELFPDLFRYIERNQSIASERGYINILGVRFGVGWWRGDNQARNYPFQGACSILFNEALLDCLKILRTFDAYVLFTVYDSLVIEAPLKDFRECQAAVCRAIAGVFENAIPQHPLKLKLTVNDQNPQCWNKPGRENALANFAIT